MKSNFLIRLITATALLGVMLALPLQAFAGSTAAKSQSRKATCKSTKKTKAKVHKPAALTAGQNDVTFGIKGGNIQPWSATIAGDGTVTTTGWEKARNGKLLDTTNALNGLFTLADAESFFTMPPMTNCTGTNPDVATRFIVLNSGSGAHQVSVHGTCVSAFNQLYAALENDVDLQH